MRSASSASGPKARARSLDASSLWGGTMSPAREGSSACRRKIVRHSARSFRASASLTRHTPTDRDRPCSAPSVLLRCIGLMLRSPVEQPVAGWWPWPDDLPRVAGGHPLESVWPEADDFWPNSALDQRFAGARPRHVSSPAIWAAATHPALETWTVRVG